MLFDLKKFESELKDERIIFDIAKGSLIYMKNFEKFYGIKQINLRYNIDWQRFLIPFVVKSSGLISSNYCFEKFRLYNEDNEEEFMYLFYIPPSLEHIFKKKIVKFSKEYYQVFQPVKSPNFSLEYLNELKNPDLYIQSELLVHLYLYREHLGLDYIIKLDHNLNKKSFKRTEININNDLFYPRVFNFIENTKNINLKLLKTEYNLQNSDLYRLNDEKILNLSVEFNQLDHLIFEIDSDNLEHLEMIANLPFPYNRVLYSEENNKLFVDIAIVGRIFTIIDLLINLEGLKFYIVLRRQKYNKISRIFNIKNKELKEITIRKLKYIE